MGSEGNEEEGNWGTITEHAGILPYLIILFIHLGNFFDRQLSVAVKSMGLIITVSWVQIPTQALSSCVTLGKLLHV